MTISIGLKTECRQGESGAAGLVKMSPTYSPALCGMPQTDRQCPLCIRILSDLSPARALEGNVARSLLAFLTTLLNMALLRWLKEIDPSDLMGSERQEITIKLEASEAKLLALETRPEQIRKQAQICQSIGR
jgi:hypothetical protein